MNDLILVNIEGGFALCRVITTLTPEQAQSLGASMVHAATPPAPKPPGPKPEVREAGKKRRAKKN